MTERGKFIVFEGILGAGKTTQAELARNYLISLGRKANYTREPGGVTSAEVIRRLIFRLRGENIINPDHQVALFFAARDFWVRDFVAANIELGIDVVSDRTYPSTAAYQGYAEGADLKSIGEMTQVIMGKYKPDGIVLLDISVQEGLRRNSNSNNGENDPFDNLGMEYFEKVATGYREMAKTNWSTVPWYVINGEKPTEDVARDVQVVLREILGITDESQTRLHSSF